jgi:hypothetical protein
MSYSLTKNKENHTNTSEMQDFESNSIALYNQQIIQILCSDTLELEIELARDLVSTCDTCVFNVDHDTCVSYVSSGKHRLRLFHR